MSNDSYLSLGILFSAAAAVLWLYNRWTRNTEQVQKRKPIPKDNAFLQDAQVSSLDKGFCPDCGSTGFYLGPSAGLCQNIECAECHQRFNVGIADGSIFHVERI